MNTFEERAKALAHAAELVERVNEENRNFESVAELLYYHDPQELADELVTAYFELTNFACSTTEDNSRLGSTLYVLRSVYEAFAKMQNSAEPTVVLKVKDTSKAI